MNSSGSIFYDNHDPVTAGFLSADPLIQDITSCLSFNSYAYCMNNPLKYSDPSGYILRRPEEPYEFFDWSCYYNYGYRTTPGGGGGGYHSYINSFGNNGYHSNGYYLTVVSYSDGITFNSLTNTYSYADGTPVPKEFLGGHYERAPFSAIKVEKHLVKGEVVIETAQEITEVWVWDYLKRIPSGEGVAGQAETNAIDNVLLGTSIWAGTVQTGFDAARKLEPTFSTVAKGAKVLGRTSNFLGGISIAYDFSTGTANTSTILNGAVMVGSAIIVGAVGIAAAPWVAGFGVVYGISSIFLEKPLNNALDISKSINFIKPKGK